MLRIPTTLGGRLLSALLAMSAIIAIQGAYGYSVLNQAGEMVVATFDGPLMAVNYARAANFDFSQIERRALQRADAPTKSRSAIDAEIRSELSVFADDLSVAEERSSESNERAQIHIIKQLMSQWSAAEKINDYTRMQSLSRQVYHAFDLLIEYNTDYSFIGRRRAVDAVSHFRFVLIAGLAAGLSISFVIATFLARSILRPLSQAAMAARSIATGHFETSIPNGAEDEIGALLASMKVMQNSIRAMVERETARAASAEVRLTDALETSDEGVILVASDGRIVIANNRIRSFFPEFAHELSPGSDYDQVQGRLFAKVTDLGNDKKEAEEYQLPDGRWLRLTVSATTEGGKIIFASDFTQIKDREESFRVAKLQAEAASAAKSRFLANMSHELRTPLNAIIGFSQIISTQLFGPIANPRYVDYSTDILRSGRHLLDVINSVLDLSKSEAGKLTLRAEHVDLRYVLMDCTKMVSDQCAQAGIVFITSGLDQELPVLGEKAKLRQIFLNLLSNAMKFTDRGGRVALMADEEEDAVIVRVVDTGIGMSPMEVEVARTPFGQVDNRLERKYEGTGLGLPLATSLIDLHAGVLTIESAPGRGTTMKVTFPRNGRGRDAALLPTSSAAAG